MKADIAAVRLGTGNEWIRLEFAYDYMGRRISKRYRKAESYGSMEEVQKGSVTILWNQGYWQKFLYDGWMLSASYQCDEEGGFQTMDQSYAWGPDLSSSTGGAGGIGGLAIYTDDFADSDGGTYIGPMYPAYDGNGNLTRMYRLGEAVGNVPDMQAAAQYEYGPFGELTGVTGVQGQRQPFRFSTKYTDAETGLLYYGYRYYSPSMGRWCSRDPIGEQASFNIYEFVFNNPECDIDPVGLDDYKKGKDDPAVSKDAGAGKFGVEDPTTIDQNKHNTWSRIVIPMARDDFGWTDAAAHMQHYLDASGDDYTIRFQAMLDDVPSAKKWYDYEKQQAMDFSETLTVGTHDITSSSIPPGLYNTQDESPNWYYAVGGYSAWGKGKVTVTACGDGGADTKFVLEFHYKFQDRYNWDKGKSVKIGGQTVNDSSMGRLHTVGLAKEFDMFGEVTETVTWTKTTRTPGRIAKPGPKKR